MAPYKVEAIESTPVSVLGEGPHWDEQRQSLYYNDIYGDKQSITRYDFNEDRAYNAVIPGHPVISFIIPVENSSNQFVVGSGKKIVLIDWDGKSGQAIPTKVVGEVESNMPENRFNDAKCDPFGRLFCGTMRIELNVDIFEKRLGTFYRYTKDEGFVNLRSQIGVSNGLTWNENTNKFYYIDSCDLDVKEFDYDPKTGNISNERVVIDFTVGGKRPDFVPDGMTIDRNGFLYVATFGSSKVFQINPKTGKIELEIIIPAEQVTSAAFGGPNLDILYVTTAAKEFKSKQPYPAGKLFKVTGLGAKGFPMKSVKLN